MNSVPARNDPPNGLPVRGDIDDIAAMLRDKYHCRTAILYGSHATGDVTSQSDYDVAGFGAVQSVERVTGPWRSSYLDLFVYPEPSVREPTAEMLHLRGGEVLFQADGLGDQLLGKIEQIYMAGPAPVSQSEIQARRNWAWKMLDRASREDAEGNFRRAWLMTALLEDYFFLRGKWYEGPKRSLSYLSTSEPHVYAAFESALKPGAKLISMERAVELTVGPRPPPMEVS